MTKPTMPTNKEIDELINKIREEALSKAQQFLRGEK